MRVGPVDGRHQLRRDVGGVGVLRLVGQRSHDVEQRADAGAVGGVERGHRGEHAAPGGPEAEAGRATGPGALRLTPRGRRGRRCGR